MGTFERIIIVCPFSVFRLSIPSFGISTICDLRLVYDTIIVKVHRQHDTLSRLAIQLFGSRFCTEIDAYLQFATDLHTPT